MHLFLLAALGGALGASARYGLSLAMLRLAGDGFPWGTFAANILGGLAMGLLVAKAGDNKALLVFLGVGVLGGFTTFSAFSLETWRMLERGALITASTYIIASVMLSVIALAIGLALGKAA
jgi:CrcB protein